MNISLLRQVGQHIAQHPERFCAANWAWAANVRDVLAEGAAPEDFRCCIAGHVLLCGGTFTERSLLHYSVICDDGFVGRCAREVLGATEQEQRRLFYPSQWTEPYRSAYYLAQTRREEAEAAVAFLDAVIAQTETSPTQRTGALPAPDRSAIGHLISHAVREVQPAL